MIKKTLVSGLLALGCLGLAQGQSSVRTQLDGRTLQFDQPSMMQDGRVMVPLRGIFESLGADVLFDARTRSIKATKGDRIVELTLGSRQAMINGQMSYLDVPAATMGGRTLVPLRFVSEALGADVRWVPSSRTVELTSTTTAPYDNPPVVSDTPKLSGLIHNARRELNSGDRLVVTVTGDPGGQASFDLLGIVNGVPMREIASGRYEGEFVVRPGMQVDKGTLVARLRKNNKEAVLESRRAVSISSTGQPLGNDSSNSFQVTPAPGSVVSYQRPTVHITMDQALMAGSARVFLDGQEVTNQANIQGNSIHFVPNSDLSSGSHRLSVQANGRNGLMQTKDWDFTVNTGNSMNQGSPTINLTNLGMGSNVPARFNVQGQTQPYAQVQVVAEAQRSLIPGIIGVNQRVTSVTRQADGNGRFDVQLDVSSVPVNAPVNLKITATDQQGRVSNPTSIDVVRR